MSAPHPNEIILDLATRALGPAICEQVVFVGGSVTGLLITDPAAAGIRETHDVDTVVETASLVDFYRIEEQLPPRGFVRDDTSSVVCRWKHPATGVMLDFMPTDPDVLGFANRWYPEAVRSSVPTTLASGQAIRVIAAPVFIATKLEAFHDRGRGDLWASHDFEDIVAVIDGRPEIVNEWSRALPELRRDAGAMLGAVLADPSFEAVLPGLVREDGRDEIVRKRIEAMLASS